MITDDDLLRPIRQLKAQLERLKVEKAKLRIKLKALDATAGIPLWPDLPEYLRKSFPDAPKGEHSPHEIVDWAKEELVRLRALVHSYFQGTTTHDALAENNDADD